MTFGILKNAQKRKDKKNAIKEGLLKIAKRRVICAKVINARISNQLEVFIFE